MRPSRPPRHSLSSLKVYIGYVSTVVYAVKIYSYSQSSVKKWLGVFRGQRRENLLIALNVDGIYRISGDSSAYLRRENLAAICRNSFGVFTRIG